MSIKGARFWNLTGTITIADESIRPRRSSVSVGRKLGWFPADQPGGLLSIGHWARTWRSGAPPYAHSREEVHMDFFNGPKKLRRATLCPTGDRPE